MSILEILVIAVALSLDAFAVTLSNSATYPCLPKPKRVLMPVTFGLFQGIMPIIGFFVGSIFADKVSAYAPYITAGVFFLLGGKVIFDCVKEFLEENKQKNASLKTANGELSIPCENKKPETVKNFTFWLLIVQAIATSIDALVIGVTFATNSVNIWTSALIIVGVTVLLTSVAVLFGKYIGEKFGKYGEICCALLLIGLGLEKIITALI